MTHPHVLRTRLAGLKRFLLISLLASFSPFVNAALLNAADDAALVALYNATGGSSWTDNTNWSATAGIMDTTKPPFGVTIDGVSGRVTEIHLGSNNLTSKISNVDFSGLSSLTILGLSNNSLTGGLPGASYLPAGINTLYLYGNQLTGTIPVYSTLTLLTDLRLHTNQLSGNLPVDTALPANIQIVYLFNNQLTGTIPDYSSLASLTDLRLYTNQLSGNLPIAIYLPPGIQNLQLSGNQLTGTIPDYHTLTALTVLIVKDNLLIGRPPPAAQLPPSIQKLNYQVNQITGVIPDYSSLASLTELYINSNLLNGNLPDVAQLPAGIQVFWVSNNPLTGTIPDYTSLASLTDLKMATMNIQGPTPDNLLIWSGTATLTTTPVIDPALDGGTYDAQPLTVTGSGGEIGGTIELLLDGTTVTTGISVGGVGDWSGEVDLTSVSDGSHTLTAVSRFDSWPGYVGGQTSTVESTAVTLDVDNPGSGGGGGGMLGLASILALLFSLFIRSGNRVHGTEPSGVLKRLTGWQG